MEAGGARDPRGVGLLGPHVDPPAAPGQVVVEPGADAEGVQQDGDSAQALGAHGEGNAGVGLERGDDAEEATGNRGAHGGGLVGAHEAVEPVAAGRGTGARVDGHVRLLESAEGSVVSDGRGVLGERCEEREGCR